MSRKLDLPLQKARATSERDTPRHWRRSSGYRIEHLLDTPRDVARLLAGSEGTLGVILDVTLDVVTRPRLPALGVVHYRARLDSLRDVGTHLRTKPSAVEPCDGVAIEQARRAPGFAGRSAERRGGDAA